MESTKNSILSTIPGAQVPQAFQGNGGQVGLSEDDAYNAYLKETGQVQATTTPAVKRTSLFDGQSKKTEFKPFSFGSFFK